MISHLAMDCLLRLPIANYEKDQAFVTVVMQSLTITW